MNTLLVSSAGLDSLAVATYYAETAKPEERILLTYFKYGSRQEAQELLYLQQLLEWMRARYLTIHWHFQAVEIPVSYFHHSTLTTGTWAPDVDTEVRGRNLMFLAIAASIADKCGYPRVAAGMNRGINDNVHVDSSLEFCNSVAQTVKLSTDGRVQVEIPFASKFKIDIWRYLESKNIHAGLSYSCYSGMPTHCGRCDACKMRRDSARIAGIHDPTTYAA